MSGASVTEWNRAVGTLWTDLLRGRNLDRGTVMEIGPGFSDKIAFGLAGLRFRGTIILAEPNPAARRWAVNRYRELLPSARVVPAAARVQELRAASRIDALLANHVLDDLLLEASTPRRLSARLFSQMRPDAPCSPAYVEAWRTSLPCAQKLATDIAASIVSLRPGLLAFNDYASWRHAAPALTPIHRLSRQMMEALRSRLFTSGMRCALRDTGSMRWLTALP